jgi:hypothetical protein
MRKPTIALAAAALALSASTLIQPFLSPARAADEAVSPPSRENSEKVPGVNPSQTLSEQLDKNNGVINPPPVGDAAINTTVPNPNPGTMPVIPPPGSAGGDERVQPK